MPSLLRALLAAAAMAVVAAPTATAALPPGYHRQFDTFVAQPGAQATEVATTCPVGTVPWGGGVAFSGGIAGTGNADNASAPTGLGWRGRYANTTAFPNDVRASVICARQPQGYTISTATVGSPPRTAVRAKATCPTGTVVLSGGAFTSSSSSAAFLLSAFPASTHAYTAVLWNGSSDDGLFTAFAVCARKPAGYELNVAGGGLSDPGPVTILGAAQCTGTKKIIGGGVKVGHPSAAVAIGSSLDEPDTQWVGDIVNSSTAGAAVTNYAICVG